jgi:hypothetical protein
MDNAHSFLEMKSPPKTAGFSLFGDVSLRYCASSSYLPPFFHA